MKVMRAVVKAESMSIKVLKTDKEDNVTADNEFNS